VELVLRYDSVADTSSKLLLESKAGVQLIDLLLPILTKLAPPPGEVDTDLNRCGEGGEGSIKKCELTGERL